MFLIFLFCFKAYATEVGEVDPAIAGVCHNISLLANIASQYTPTYQIAVSPAPPYTGIVVGLTQRTNVMVDFCNFVNDFQTLGTQGKVRLSKNMLNDLTANKWKEHSDQFDRTWDLADSAYDFESGERREGYLGSAQADRDLNDYVKETRGYVDRSFNSEDAQSDSAKNRQIDLAEIAKNARDGAILKEATQCPDAENNPNYRNIYDKDIRPQVKIRDADTENAAYFKEKLIQIGTKFLNNVGEMDEYFNDVYALESRGITFDVQILKRTDTSVVPSKTRKNADGTPKQNPKELSRIYQKFTAKIFDNMFTNFSQKWNGKWQDWIRYTYLTKTSIYGLLGAQERIEAEFRDLSAECRESILMAGMTPDQANYELEYDKRNERCKNSTEVDQKKSENLLQYYATQYQNALYRKQQATAKIWSVESEILRINRFISKNNNTDVSSFREEDIKCTQTLEPSEMKLLAVKQRNVLVKSKEIIAKNMMKKTIRMQEKQRSQKEYSKDIAERAKFTQKKMNDEQRARENTGTVVSPIRGTPGANK